MNQPKSPPREPPADTRLDHPGLETWIAYHDGQLPEAEASRLRGHLMACRECSGVVLDLDAFAHPPSPGSEVADLGQEAVWRSLRRAVRGRSGWRFSAAVAAGLFAALGLFSWSQHRSIVELDGLVAELSKPQISTRLVHLAPHSVKRSRARGSEERVELELSSGPHTLVLNLALEPMAYRDFEITVLDAGGSEVLSIPGLPPSPENYFVMALPRRSLAVGDYEVQIFGLEGGKRDLLEAYAVNVR